MKKKLKQLWIRRPRMSRGWKIVQNLGLFMLLIFGFWFGQGCPALTSNSALRELERRMFLEPGTTMYQTRGENTGGRYVFVKGEDYAYTGSVSRYALHELSAGIKDECAADEAIKPLRLPAPQWETYGKLWNAELFVPCWDENTIQAELSLTVDYTQSTYELHSINGKTEKTQRGTMLSSEQMCWEYTTRVPYKKQGYYSFSIEPGNDAQAMLVSALWRGIGYINTGDTETEVVIGSVRYRLDFYGRDNILLNSVEGTLDDWR